MFSIPLNTFYSNIMPIYAIKHIPSNIFICEDDEGYYLSNDDTCNTYDDEELPCEALVCTKGIVKTDKGDFHISEFQTVEYHLN